MHARTRWAGLLVVGALLGADAPASQTRRYLVNDEFEEWVWKPITASMMQEGRQALAQGLALGYEYRGPLFRLPKGSALPAGRMIEGPEAFRGRSLLLVCDARAKGRLEVGLHDRYAHLVEPARTYHYSVALKGRGAFQFLAWVGGTAPATGQFAWLGFPVLIHVPVTETWKVYTGTFRLPAFDESTYRIDGKCSAAIVVEPGSAVAVDDFRLWPAEEGSP